MPIKTNHRHSGFSLVELLTVIAIIGILAALIIPAIGKSKELANRQKAASNVRQIAIAYATYANSTGRTRAIPSDTATDIYLWAQILADEVELNDAALYYVDVDPSVAALATLPKVVSINGVLNTDFNGSPVGYEAVAGLSPRAPASTTPLIWSRDLKTDGTWDAITSPWEGAGGHIGYVDGHVEWYNNLGTGATSGEVINYTTKAQTSNITETINASAKIVTQTAPTP